MAAVALEFHFISRFEPQPPYAKYRKNEVDTVVEDRDAPLMKGRKVSCRRGTQARLMERVSKARRSLSS